MVDKSAHLCGFSHLLHLVVPSLFLLLCDGVTVFTGAVNVNFTVMMKRRFMSGKITIQDLVTTDEGKKKFKVRSCRLCCHALQSVVIIFIFRIKNSTTSNTERNSLFLCIGKYCGNYRQ